MRQVSTKELREFLMKYLKQERQMEERSVNYYNSVIRFIYDVVLDYPINQKQLPMYKKKRRLPKILSEQELSIFFNACENYMYKTIFMMIYGSGLRISEAETLEELARDKKYLGAEIGFMGILHTWGQTLVYHPHIHCVVPAGGIDKIGKWRNSKKKFFIPVKVLSRKFRGKFLYYLKQEKLEYYGENEYFNNPEEFDKLMSKMYNKEWISYCKPPFENAKSVIKYLGRYTHRVAISNSRIIKEENGEITFTYRDYKDNKKIKEMRLKVEEFIRRFTMHILPPRFMKIRHYGLLGNRNKKTKLAICKKLTNTANFEKQELTTLEILKKTLGVDFNLCPHCHKGHLLAPNTG